MNKQTGYMTELRALYPDLPTEPVDQYRVTWWTLWPDSTDVRVRKVEWLYHTNTPWNKVSGRPRFIKSGADFMDVWQIFLDDKFEGRSGAGWHAIFRYYNTAIFLTRNEALFASLEVLLAKLATFIDQAEECTEAIKRIREEMRPPRPKRKVKK